MSGHLSGRLAMTRNTVLLLLVIVCLNTAFPSGKRPVPTIRPFLFTAKVARGMWNCGIIQEAAMTWNSARSDPSTFTPHWIQWSPIQWSWSSNRPVIQSKRIRSMQCSLALIESRTCPKFNSNGLIEPTYRGLSDSRTFSAWKSLISRNAKHSNQQVPSVGPVAFFLHNSVSFTGIYIIWIIS